MQTLAQQQLDQTPALAKLNLVVEAADRNTIRLRLPLAGNTNHFGAMYAGSLFSLAEFPFGVLFLNEFAEKPLLPLIGEMSIRYLKPVVTDATVTVTVSDEEWAEIEAKTLADGKFKFERTAEVVDTTGDVVCKTTGTYFSVMKPT
ncbi:MAG: PaaI family thioesterase [Actinomycetia bacterium]|nr:PaaI family thioesterase [Actinomycetes bacterium]